MATANEADQHEKTDHTVELQNTQRTLDERATRELIERVRQLLLRPLLR